MANQFPMPLTDALVVAPNPNLAKGQRDSTAYQMSETWVKYFQQQGQTASQTPGRLQSVGVQQAGTAILTTTLWPTTTAGLYRITWYARITRAATVSSSLTLTLGWTDNTVALTSAQTAITGNTTSTFQSGTLTVNADRLTNLTYAAAYASVGATSMQYSLQIAVEGLAL